MVNKLVVDGKVAVLYSPGYGAGWSTWNQDHAEWLCMDRDLVEAVQRKDWGCIERMCEGRSEDIYTGGMTDLKVYWVPQGMQFEILEYDGSESVSMANQRKYMTA